MLKRFEYGASAVFFKEPTNVAFWCPGQGGVEVSIRDDDIVANKESQLYWATVLTSSMLTRKWNSLPSSCLDSENNSPSARKLTPLEGRQDTGEHKTVVGIGITFPLLIVARWSETHTVQKG